MSVLKLPKSYCTVLHFLIEGLLCSLLILTLPMGTVCSSRFNKHGCTNSPDMTKLLCSAQRCMCCVVNLANTESVYISMFAL